VATILEKQSDVNRGGFVSRNPVAFFFALACFLSLFAYFFEPYFSTLFDTIESMGVPFRTSLVFGLQIYLTNPDTLMGILGLIYHPFTPTIAALIVVGYLGGWNAIRELLSRLRPWQKEVPTKDALKIWLVAIATFMAIYGSAALIKFIFAAPGQFTWTPGQFGWLPVWAWFIAGLFTDGGGVGEELGWRGFASSFLQSKYAPLKAAIFLGLLWAAWHFPGRLPDLFTNTLPWIYEHLFFVVTCVSTTIIIMYFSNKLGGTAIVGLMIHSQMNDSFGMRGVLSGISRNDSLELFSRSIPEIVAALIIIYISKGQLAFNAENPGRQVWTWPKRAAKV
jgi:uncharacterized protein